MDAKGTVDQRLFRLAFLLLASDDAVAHEGQIWTKERTAMRSTEHGTPEPSEPSPESSPFDKAPWLFQKGNKMGAGRRDMAAGQRDVVTRPASERYDPRRDHRH